MMRKYIILGMVLTAMSFLNSCQKEVNYSLEIAGVYEVTDYELHYYSNLGATLDSTFEDHDLGVVTFFADDADVQYNTLSFNLKGGRLEGWSRIPVTTPITWGMVEKTNEIMHFSNAPDGDPFLNEITLVTYNVDYKSFGRIVISWVDADPATGAMLRHEVVHLKRMY
jgi:hypothetical protein